MSTYKLIVINTDPICENSIENIITGVTSCSRYFLQLNPSSHSKGPFDIYVDTIESIPLYDNITREQFLIGVTVELDCITPTPTKSITPTNTTTPTVTPSISITPTVTPTIPVTPSNTATPTITPTKTVTPTSTVTPTVTPTQPELFAYLFIEPVSLNVDFSNWMGVSNTFKGFSNGIGPSISANTFNQQLNKYISYSGWGVNAPQVRIADISRVSGGLDNYGNLIQDYLFKTHEVPANTVSGYSWYTWVISTGATLGNTLSNIGVNNFGDPNSLTPVGLNLLYGNLTIDYTGSTIPQSTYRVYTTFNDTNFRLLNDNNIYFKGNSFIALPTPTPTVTPTITPTNTVTPTITPSVSTPPCNCFDVFIDPFQISQFNCNDVCYQEDTNTTICGKYASFNGSNGSKYYITSEDCQNQNDTNWFGPRKFSINGTCYDTNEVGVITGSTICPSPTPTNTLTPTNTPTNTPTTSITPTPTTTPAVLDCFVSSSGFDDTVGIIIEASDGDYFMGGAFTLYSGVSYNRLIKLNYNGTIDTSFNIGSGFNSTVTDVKQQTDGKVIVTGYFTSYSGVSYNRLIRLNTDGSIDNSFVIGSGFSSGATQPNKIIIQSDNKIIVYGMFTSYSGVSYNNVIRLNSDGSIDSTFSVGSGFNSNVFKGEVQTDDKIIFVGAFTSYNGSAYNRIIRLNSNGSIDTSFVIGTGFGFLQNPNAIKIQPDGNIIIAGSFTSYNGSAYNRIVRLNTNGGVDTSFVIGTGFNAGGDYDLQLQADNKIIVAGRFSSYSGVSVNRVVKLNTNGSIDSTFSMTTVPSISELYTVKLLTNNKIIVGGYITSIYTNMVYRVNNNGSNDVCT